MPVSASAAQQSQISNADAQHGKEPVAGALPGQLLTRAAASGSVFARSNFPYRSNLIKLFQNPAISADDKAIAAAKIAAELKHGDIENPLHACGLVRCAAAFMSPKDRAAAVRRLAYLLIPLDGPKQQSADPISAIADLLADLEDGDTRREISEMLKRECERQISTGGFKNSPQKAAERIRLDPDNALHHLGHLLELSLKVFWEDVRNEIAIATFQADPDGNAYVPGTEVIDKKKNTLNDEYVESGTKFAYDREPWLVQRRAQLQEFARSAGLNGGIFGSAMHDLQAHAQISRDYAGITVFPSDWPRLREHLQTLHAEAMYLPQMRRAIEDAMHVPDPVRALMHLCPTFCPAEERARIDSEILGVYAQRGGEAQQKCLELLAGFLRFQQHVLCYTEISSATLGQLIDRLVLPGSSQDSMLPTAMAVCGRLCGAQHEDITPLYGLANILIERVLRIGYRRYPIGCAEMIGAIPDPRVQIALAEKVMTHIANLPELSDAEVDTLISVAETLKTREGLEVAGPHLGKILVRMTAPPVGRFKDAEVRLETFQALFAHPAISEADKRRAATQLATDVVRGTLMSSDSDTARVDSKVTSAAPFMTQADRTATAQRLRITISAMTGPTFVSRISTISALVAGVEDDPDCREVQEFLIRACERYLHLGADAYKAAMVAELIRLDPERGLRILPRLLEHSVLIDRNRNTEMCNRIAIATFQADPMGEAFVPGSEVVDVAKNPLSDSYIDRGTKFVYPQWLAIRRAELLSFSQASSARVAAQIHQGIPQSVLALARIEEEYSGISIQPSDWPALGAHLMKVFPVAS